VALRIALEFAVPVAAEEIPAAPAGQVVQAGRLVAALVFHREV